ncbi:MAG TPA: SDR family NAD(P)-dependent oxidoreductase [Acidimicrobiales bacterium]|nr:SDR family NAD(P)-dependent oxidoreductase [Acidimicrobiales bacterium]
MDALSFEGRVAVVTGAGRGIGRAYALLLASRGARVVVNDLGGSMQGTGTDAAVASSVAAEIEAAGGTALADEQDVASTAGAEALVAATVARFGRLDVLINNAGIIKWAGLPGVDLDNLQRHLAVHVAGSFNTTRAAWPVMAEQQYGRIVMTTSSGVFGLPKNLSYATAKAGVIGLTRSIATMSEAHGIRVNLIAPAAFTRMAGQAADAGPDDAGPDDAGAPMAPDLVAPLAAFLAHEACPVNGELYTAGAGRFARVFIASTPGYVSTSPTIEDVAAHWDAINDEKGYVVPRDLPDWSTSFLSHLPTER